MKKCFSFVVVLMVVASAWAGGGPGSEIPIPPVTGQLPASMEMLASVKALESYAKEQVAQASCYGGSSGIVLPGGRTWAQVYLEDPDIREIQNLLSKELLSFRVTDPKAQMYLGAFLMDEAGYVLFNGQNWFQLEEYSEDSWRLPKGAADVQLELVAEVPIQIPGVQSAFVVLSSDKAGGPGGHVWLNTWNGRVFFPTWLAGQGGQLVLSVGDTGAAYDLSTGQQVPTTGVEANVSASIKNLAALDDPVEIFFDAGEEPSDTENPLYQASFSSEKSVAMYAIAPGGEVATSVVVRRVGEPVPAVYPVNPGEMTMVNFEPGVYDIWFIFPTWDGGNPPPPPEGGGGMG